MKLQVLYLEHSVDSLARGGPWQLGKVIRGGSAWRPLRDSETEAYGGSTRRLLYGCVVTIFNSSCSSSVPVIGSSTKLDEYHSIKLSKNLGKLQSLAGSLKKIDGGRLGTSASFTIPVAPDNNTSTFQQHFLTWSRVR